MVATKVTQLFHASTTDFEGNGKRIAGFTESWYSLFAITSQSLLTNWSKLCQLRAALMSKNVTMIGQRFNEVDPTGGSRSYDTAYNPPGSAASDLPGMALQWTVRSTNSPNQRSVILRGIPDARIINGEYFPSDSYNAALKAYFDELKQNWQFRCIDRTVLPVKLINVAADGVALTFSDHGFVAGDRVMFMSVTTKYGHKHSAEAVVTGVTNARSFTIAVSRLDRDQPTPLVQDSQRGKVRKINVQYRNITITDQEIVAPVAIHRDTGRPFRQFRGRRTVKK